MMIGFNDNQHLELVLLLRASCNDFSACFCEMTGL